MCDFSGLLDVYVLGQDNETMIDEIMFNKTKPKVGTNNNNLPGKSTKVSHYIIIAFIATKYFQNLLLDKFVLIDSSLHMKLFTLPLLPAKTAGIFFLL